MKKQLRGYWPWLLAGFIFALVVAGLILALYTQTKWGREQVLGFTVETLGGQFNGTLVVERLEGNLFTGARLYGISLHDLDGEPFVAADSAYIEYRIPTFLGGDIVIEHLEVYAADLHLTRMPGDSLWNYQRVLQDTTPDTVPDPAPRATFIERMRLVTAVAAVEMEWMPDPDLSAAERQRELDDALSNTGRLVVREVPGGYVRSMRFEVQEGLVSELFIGPDSRGGTYLRVDSLDGEAWLWRDPPLVIRDLAGEMNLREGVLRFNAPRLTLPSTDAELAGRLDMGEEELAYSISMTSDRVAFADLQWLYPRFPDEGGGAVTLRLQSREDGLFFLARDLDLRAPGTHVTGQFGMILGDTLRFVDTNLQAEPLRVQTVEEMLPGDLPVQGLFIGGAEIRSGMHAEAGA